MLSGVKYQLPGLLRNTRKTVMCTTLGQIKPIMTVVVGHRGGGFLSELLIKMGLL